MNLAPSRLPAMAALVLFIALCVSIAYWLLQWLAPAPRPVAAPAASERIMPVASAAANLFGGAAKGGATLNIQLRGIIHAGQESGSVAIMAIDGNPPRYYRVRSELMPGVTVKSIHARKVLLSDRGAERELALPAFSSQESSAVGIGRPAMPEPAAAPQLNQPLPPQQSPTSMPGQASGQAPGQMPAPAPGQPQPSGASSGSGTAQSGVSQAAPASGPPGTDNAQPAGGAAQAGSSTPSLRSTRRLRGTED